MKLTFHLTFKNGLAFIFIAHFQQLKRLMILQGIRFLNIDLLDWYCSWTTITSPTNGSKSLPQALCSRIPMLLCLKFCC